MKNLTEWFWIKVAIRWFRIWRWLCLGFMEQAERKGDLEMWAEWREKYNLANNYLGLALAKQLSRKMSKILAD